MESIPWVRCASGNVFGLCRKKGAFLASCYVVVTRFCRDMSFVAFTRFFGLVLMQILCRFLHKKMLCGSSALDSLTIFSATG